MLPLVASCRADANKLLRYAAEPTLERRLHAPWRLHLPSSSSAEHASGPQHVMTSCSSEREAATPAISGAQAAAERAAAASTRMADVGAGQRRF